MRKSMNGLSNGLLITCFSLLIFFQEINLSPVSILKKERSFTTGKRVFLKDGEPYQILSGAIHYFRIVPERWNYTMRLAKEAGLNTIESYVPWGLHQPENIDESIFTGLLDIENFLKLAQENQLNVILRIGPYSCAELNFGGLPIWLMSMDIEIRRNSKEYMFFVSKWMSILGPIIIPFLYINGGNVIIIQVENEYSLGGICDKVYLSNLESMFRQYFETTLLTTVDNCQTKFITCGNGNHSNNLLATIDFGYDENIPKCFNTYWEYNPEAPILVSEFWTGWFSVYGHHRNTVDSKLLSKALNEILAYNASLNFYVFMGGTNYDYEGGTQGLREQLTTSYDYDAPLNEGAVKMEKYYMIQKTLRKDLKYSPSQKYDDLYPACKYEDINPYATISIFTLLENATDIYYVDAKDSLEYYKLYHGYAVFKQDLPKIETTLNLTIDDTYDEAVVLIDQNIVGQTRNGALKLSLNSSHSEKGIFILLQLFGHQSATFHLDHKRLGNVKLGDKQFNKWLSSPFILENLTSLNKTEIFRLGSSNEPVINKPSVSYAKLNLTNVDINDTYMDLRPCYSSGYVFINSFNIGYFNNILPPQYTLYIPNSILKNGINEILIFDFHGLNASIPYQECKISFLNNPIWD